MGEGKRKKLAWERLQQQRAAEQVPGDAEIVLQAADGFRECSRPFCNKVRALEREAAIEEGRRNKGDMIASAANLGFSIELYLKALRIVSDQPPSRTHDLSALYTGLPPALRQSIEAEYDAVPKSPGLLYLGLSITHKHASAEEQASKPDSPTDQSLPAVLERGRNVFGVWRYVHDQGEPGRVKRFLYEFHLLGIVADVFRNHVARLSSRGV